MMTLPLPVSGSRRSSTSSYGPESDTGPSNRTGSWGHLRPEGTPKESSMTSTPTFPREASHSPRAFDSQLGHTFAPPTDTHQTSFLSTTDSEIDSPPEDREPVPPFSWLQPGGLTGLESVDWSDDGPPRRPTSPNESFETWFCSSPNQTNSAQQKSQESDVNGSVYGRRMGPNHGTPLPILDEVPSPSAAMGAKSLPTSPAKMRVEVTPTKSALAGRRGSESRATGRRHTTFSPVVEEVIIPPRRSASVGPTSSSRWFFEAEPEHDWPVEAAPRYLNLLKAADGVDESVPAPASPVVAPAPVVSSSRVTVTFGASPTAASAGAQSSSRLRSASSPAVAGMPWGLELWSTPSPTHPPSASERSSWGHSPPITVPNTGSNGYHAAPQATPHPTFHDVASIRRTQPRSSSLTFELMRSATAAAAANGGRVMVSSPSPRIGFPQPTTFPITNSVSRSFRSPSPSPTATDRIGDVTIDWSAFMNHMATPPSFTVPRKSATTRTTTTTTTHNFQSFY